MIPTPAPEYCANHPSVETTLHCNRCGKPICARCAVLTPTGYRCKECVHLQQKVFVTAQWYDYLLGFATAGILSLLASLLAVLVSSIPLFGWILIIIGAPTVGAIMAEAIRFVTRKHRSKALFITIAAAMVVGALPIFFLFTMNIFDPIFLGIFLVLATPVVYTRLSGIQLFR